MGNDFWGIHKHHIVFRSQGGLDIEDNLIELTQEEHEGNDGPHQSIKRDRELKRQMQNRLFEKFPEGDLFDIGSICLLLGKTKRYIEPRFKKVKNDCGIYRGEDIVRHLMGGRLY